MENWIIIVIIMCVVSGIIWYLHRAKKRGETCIGCPYAKQCGSKCNGQCNDAKAEKKRVLIERM